MKKIDSKNKKKEEKKERRQDIFYLIFKDTQQKDNDARI